MNVAYKNRKISGKPFVKWAGGKTQLVETISSVIPEDFGTKLTKYAEPFIGGGAMLFYVLKRFSLQSIYISDVNFDLINCYKAIQQKSDELIDVLLCFQEEFCPLDSDARKKYYYNKRSLFNEMKREQGYEISVARAALFIYLNKTCFNGLYRENSKGEYNVPMGAYKNPVICDSENILAITELLQKVEIIKADYRQSEKFIDQNTLVYFDPPYRPLNNTSSFTSYNAGSFTDDDQIELANYYKKLDARGAKLILSNSDPKNAGTNDDFFDRLYEKFNIRRVSANRMINSNATKRGKLTELLITNY